MLIGNVEAIHSDPNGVEYCPPYFADLNRDKIPSRKYITMCFKMSRVGIPLTGAVSRRLCIYCPFIKVSLRHFEMHPANTSSGEWTKSFYNAKDSVLCIKSKHKITLFLSTQKSSFNLNHIIG